MGTRVARRTRGTIVLVTDRRLFPAREGSRARIVELIRALRTAGYFVVVVIRRVPGRLRGLLPAIRPALATWRLADRVVQVDGAYFHYGSPVGFDAGPYREALARVVARYRPLAVIAEYLWMAPVLDDLPPGVVRMVDTHDVMHLRRAIYAGEPEGAWVECDRGEEVSLLARAEVVIAIQPREAEVLREMVPDRRVICVPHAVGVPDRLRPAPAGSANVVFVGSRIQGNVTGMRSFLEGAWPVVRAARPDAVLRVYGDVVTRLDADAADVDLVGYVEDLEDAYAAATVVINPVALGTGLKIKTVEALARGRAVVTTSCGADGLPDANGEAFLVEDDMVRFGEAVVRLLDEAGLRAGMEARAAALARESYSPRAAIRELVEELDRRGASPGRRAEASRPVGGPQERLRR